MSHWLTERTGIVPTSPPSRRLSRRTVLDEQTRPEAPEPESDVTFTERGLAAGRHLIEVHDRYRAELEQVRDLLDRVTKGITDVGAARDELNRMAIRANNWTLGGVCQGYCVAIAQHHTLEDEHIYPHLRRSDERLTEVLDRLTAEHHVIHDLLQDVDAALVHLAQHPTDTGPITEAVNLLTDTLLSHFAYEERELVGHLARHGFYPGQV